MNERSPLGASRREDTSPLTNKGYSEYGGGRNDPLAMLKMHGEFLEKLRSRAKEEVSDEHSHTMNTIDLTGKINALIADIQHKNEIIEELSEEIEEMREIERENEQLKKDNGIIIAKCQEYVEKMSAVDDQVETLICEVERLKKESSDWKAKARENLSLFHDIEPKYISLVQETNTSNAIYVHKIQMLEEIVTSERNKNISLIDRAHKAEEDVKTLQITFEEMKERAEELESKLISAAVLESQNASLKEQIEEVREERNRIYESVDRVVREKNEEIARLGFKIEDALKTNMKINEEVTHKERRILDLTLKLKKANEEISRLKKINSRADDTLKYKDSQMEVLRKEIGTVNDRVSSFGGITDKLVEQNCEMKVRLEEFERKEKFLKNTNPWALMRAASKDGISTKYRLGDHTYS